ncbi:hypothetical protein MXB_3487, partial [Myxobolus squamalis]
MEVNEFIMFEGMDSKSRNEYAAENYLTILDELILPDFQSIRRFMDNIKILDYNIYFVFINLLNNEEDFPESFIIILCKWLKKELDISGNEYMCDVVNSLQLILRVSKVRYTCNSCKVVKTLAHLLIKSSNYQLHYQIIFCLWLISYETKLVDVLIENSFKIIIIFNEILKNVQKNKVIRICLTTCRNIIEKSSHADKILALFVYNKFIPILQSFEKRVFNDEDLEEDLKYLIDVLLKTVQDLSTYDEYAGELLNGKLEWSPVHRSDKFWRENAHRLCENNYELLLVLINALSAEDPISIAIACHDIGEFVRYYCRGKLVLQEHKGVENIMALLYHDDSNVKYEALISLQKIMVHN